LPEYMVPVAVVVLEELPLTASGKVDRKALPAPESGAYAVPDFEAPVGETETALASIWAEVLKVKRVGRHDNFFQLGGHSLLTLRVVSLLEQINISISALEVFTHPTIHGLGARLVSQGRQILGPKAICVRASGPEPPLFFPHCGAGELFYVAALSPHIETAISIYGLPSSTTGEPPLRTIEGMAMRMAQMIRDVQADGPYHLAGWSFGGTLAYEIAARLINLGQRVEFLGLLDTGYFAGLKDSPLPYMSDFDRTEGVLVTTQTRTGENTLSARLVETCEDMLLIPKNSSNLTISHIQQAVNRMKIYTEACSRYLAQPISIPIHLFVAQNEHPDVPFLGWNAVLPESQIRVTPVAGTHYSMMAAPNIDRLGRALSHAIQTANRDPNDALGVTHVSS
jgi:thioesterase domain-containing protein